MATEVKERSVPKPVFTDAEAGAQEFPSWTSRNYNYFTPRKRRATVYEDVTTDVADIILRHLTTRIGNRVGLAQMISAPDGRMNLNQSPIR